MLPLPGVLLFLGALASPPQGRLVIYDVRVATLSLDGFEEPGYVVVEGERIVSVGTGRAPGRMTADQVVEGRGGYLIPGLIDAHTHLGAVLGMNGGHERAHPELAAAWFDQLPKSLLYFGYTTVIELGGRSKALEDIRARKLRPDVYDCHFPLVLANGYGMVFEPPESRFASHPNFLYDPRQADAIPAAIDPARHSPEATVRRVAENGGICVKAHWEDGFGGIFDWPTPTEELIGEVIGHAHGYGLPVVLHANSLSAWEFGARVEVDHFVHGLWHWGVENGELGLPERVRAVLDLVLEQGQGFMPTMQVVFGERDTFAPAYLDDPQLAHVVPASLIEWYATPEGQWFREDLEGFYQRSHEMLAELGFESLETDEERAAVTSLFVSQVERTVAYLAANEGRFLFGSDTPSSPNYTNPAGYNGYLEMQRWHAAGVPLEVILRAATLHNAEAFGLDDELGSIERGKLAHMLLLTENPLETISAYDSIAYVFVRGKLVRRRALSATAR